MIAALSDSPRTVSASAAVAAAVRRARMSTPRPSTIKPLGHSVSECIDDYFKTLNGHTPTGLYDLVLSLVEPPLLRATLRHCNNNQSRAAEALGMNRATLRKKLREYNIDARDA